MGFESIVAFVILFSVGLSAVVGVAIFYKDYLLKTTNTLDEKQELLSDKTSSDIDFVEVSYLSPDNDVMTVTNENQFSEGILDNINISSQTGNLTILNNSNIYYESGNWTSRIYNMNHPSNFSNVHFYVENTVNTWIGIQMRTSESLSGLIGNFLGPDGTIDTYYTISGETINSIHLNHTYMQFKVYLNTTDLTEAPIVSEINFTFKFAYGSLKTKVKNSGKVKLSTEIFDIFINEDRIARNHGNLTAYVISSTEIENPGIWDPSETLEIQFPYNLKSGQNVIRFLNEYSNGDYIAFES